MVAGIFSVALADQPQIPSTDQLFGKKSKNQFGPTQANWIFYPSEAQDLNSNVT